jgi:isocitrate dehydrogenase (NAD+)
MYVYVSFFTHYTLSQAPIDWDPVDVTPVKGLDGRMHIPSKCIDLMHVNLIGLKGPLATPIGKGHRSLNLALRK